MPGEKAHQSPERLSRTGVLDFTVSQHGRAVWVSLSGVLDRDGIDRLVRRVHPLLTGREAEVVLDGSRLLHVDYRAVRLLVQWHRSLKAFGHQLWLARWSRYLQAIVSLEDWAGELEVPPSPRSFVSFADRVQPSGMP
jgi:ABC-type transporter Mla MlaB component